MQADTDQADNERAEALGLLLRQLASGFSAYRLFPGDTGQPGFQAAVTRFRDAAEDVLGDGPVEVGVHGDDFHAPDLPPGGEQREGFARTLFERRVEWLEVRSIPDADELAAFYAAVAQTPEELTDQGGLDTVLRDQGVTALAVRGVALRDIVDEVSPHLELDDEQRDLWNRLADPAGFAASLLVENLGGGTAADRAQWVYRRFATVLSILPEQLGNSVESFSRFQQISEHLPAPVQRAFNSLTVTRADRDLLAMGHVGTMSDADLARMLVDIGESGPDPVDLAERLVEVAGRREDVVDLTKSLARGGEQGGTIVAEPADTAGFSEMGLTDRGWGTGAGTGASAAAAGSATDGGPEIGREPEDTDGDGKGTVAGTAADLLAREVSLAADEDVEAVRATFPDTDADVRILALTALRDYLKTEFDHDRLGQSLESCATGLRDAVEDDDLPHFQRLLRTIDVAVGTDAPRRELLAAHRGKVLNDHVVTTLIERGREHGHEAIEPYLAPFDGLAVDRLLDHLADEEDRGVRAWLIGAIADFARSDGEADHTGLVTARLDDDRWFVVRNALTILQRVGGKDALPEVVRTAEHAEPRVRREVVRTLATLAGADAVVHLERLARDADADVATAARNTLAGLPTAAAAAAVAGLARRASDGAETRELLDLLGEHAAPQATQRLHELGSRSSQPRLSWRLRRHARKLAKERERGAA